MSKSKHRPARAYRPGPVHLNAVEIALRRTRLLSAADIDAQRTRAIANIDGLTLGAGLAVLAKPGDDAACLVHWQSLADVGNVAETMASMGLGSGPQADEIITTAQIALRDVFLKRQIMGVWALEEPQVDALRWLVALHCGTQLKAASYGEFERAYVTTENRQLGVLSGNGPPGAIVVTGLIGSAVGT